MKPKPIDIQPYLFLGTVLTVQKIYYFQFVNLFNVVYLTPRITSLYFQPQHIVLTLNARIY